MNPELLLVAGFPRAGKSSFADAVERSDLGFAHVPMDRYIMPIPGGMSFLEWVKEPACVDWNLLAEHLDILNTGRVCFTPKPDWSQRGRRECAGGAISDGRGRRMLPTERGYLVEGTHVYSLKAVDSPIKVFIETPDLVLASRLEGRAVSEEDKDRVIRHHLSENLVPLQRLRGEAELVIDGTWTHEDQVQFLRDFLIRKWPNQSLQTTIGSGAPGRV